MTTRYVLIRYQDSAGNLRVGSGYIVRGSTVLTANHVANGRGHQIECDNDVLIVDGTKTVLSGTNEVDLGILEIAGNPLRLVQLPFARVGRDSMIVNDCTAVGFPRWTADEKDRQYESKQVDGLIKTADRVRMRQDGGADSQLLRLTIEWHDSDQRVPVPDGQLDGEPTNPWGGMSGAAVTIPGQVVIGVVHSHNYARDPHVLTVTPLLALKRLPDAKRRQFCDALGIEDLDALTEVADRTVSMSPRNGAADQPSQPQAPALPAPVFSDGVRDKCRQALASLGLPVPSPWNCAALERLYRDCEQRVSREGADPGLCRARDLTKALWLASAALPLLSDFGGREIGIRKLQYLYHGHVRSLPESATLDGMLITAADVGIGETYEAANGRGQPGDEAVTALGRFMLGIASHWKACREPTATVDFGEIVGWLTEHLGLQSSDIDTYVADIQQRIWVLIELETPELDHETRAPTTREMPTAIILHAVRETGKFRSRRFDCQPTSEEEVAELLRKYLTWLPGGDFIVDLLLPRDWLDARVEHWDLLEVAGAAESLSKKHDPHLRWSKHWRDSDLASRLRSRFASMQWMDSPGDIPPGVTSDPDRLKAWLDDRNQPGTEDPPYFIGSSHGARDHDPLGDLLLEGYGFITWFTGEATSPIRQTAVGVASAFPSAWERKDGLPRQLTTKLRQHDPIIIWSDPDKREDFDLPRTKSRSLRRSVRK